MRRIVEFHHKAAILDFLPFKPRETKLWMAGKIVWPPLYKLRIKNISVSVSGNLTTITSV